MAGPAARVDFKIKGEKALLNDLSRFAPIKRALISKVLDEEAINIQTGAKKRVPTDEGRLKTSIKIEKPKKLTRQIGSEVGYALYVEKGTKPHTPPIEPLKEWAGRVLGDESAAWLVQKKISEEGTDAQPYLGPAYFFRRRPLMRKIKDVLDDASSFPTLRET